MFTIKASEKFERRLARIQKAVSLETPDRVPVVLEYAGFAANATQTPMSEFISSRAAATTTMIMAYDLVGGGDAINYGSFAPYDLCYLFGAKVKVPGFDLPDNDIWQVAEAELMTVRDYDRILDSCLRRNDACFMLKHPVPQLIWIIPVNYFQFAPF